MSGRTYPLPGLRARVASDLSRVQALRNLAQSIVRNPGWTVAEDLGGPGDVRYWQQIREHAARARSRLSLVIDSCDHAIEKIEKGEA